MKLIRRKDEQFVFEMNDREKSLLHLILNQFPLVPRAHHRLRKTKKLPNAEASAQLLEETLKSQQLENRKWLMAMLEATKYFKSRKEGFHFTIKRPEIERLLQVLNDVRVGSWLALGAPDLDEKEKLEVTEKTAAHVYRMELAGAFEMFFLEALTGTA
jgi:hypothetical protein